MDRASSTTLSRYRRLVLWARPAFVYHRTVAQGGMPRALPRHKDCAIVGRWFPVFWKKKKPQTHGGPTIEERQQQESRQAQLETLNFQGTQEHLMGSYWFHDPNVRKGELFRKWEEEDRRLRVRRPATGTAGGLFWPILALCMVLGSFVFLLLQ